MTVTDGSTSAYLLWAILACLFQGFLLYHLWSYDGFKCLRWDAGRQPGAFRRVMTYSYLACIPLLVIFSVGLTVVKFHAGEVVYPDGSIMPKPVMLWDDHDRAWVLPLYFILSIAWALEIITHLEELVFWLFLLHQGPTQRDWYESWEFRTWYIGSTIAILGMPITVLITRRQLWNCLAYIFLTGSSAGILTTIAFLYVLWQFPVFLAHVKSEGADPDVVVRLTTFSQLNVIRVLFRFLFSVPLLVLGIDVISGRFCVVDHKFATDFCLEVAAVGCFASSTITLLIFFPRSITRESGYKPKEPSPLRTPTTTAQPFAPYPYAHQQPNLPTFDYVAPDHHISASAPANISTFTFAPGPMHRQTFAYPTSHNEQDTCERGDSVPLSWRFPSSRSSQWPAELDQFAGFSFHQQQRLSEDSMKFPAETPSPTTWRPYPTPQRIHAGSIASPSHSRRGSGAYPDVPNYGEIGPHRTSVGGRSRHSLRARASRPSIRPRKSAGQAVSHEANHEDTHGDEGLARAPSSEAAPTGSTMHPFALNFTSPIDFMPKPPEEPGGDRDHAAV
ncbi:hypothetical protein PUNSTDRAFT_105437 [Punctularia strigosozonata HHB-11173 SS5]|uniref:uncharacterized protein n=1 Tax=Punctularia strigosozonata (strain HHB-11173) TaxID=741275 RepID=UPI0004417C4D|nr:uncharacterized protein PUNSTDRAFT_105437 [Punctularia strigosozonata HHB-11173 SS5]EIN06437.1 hypothetical protein PUNSTDRAFT_105437 [Punctularia strigosozonata HHB-11173 SS5]